jgi:exo-1,4-beta-D-glucosaminidase
VRLHRGEGKILGLILLVSAPCQAAAQAGARIDLSEGWSIQSSAHVAEKGDAISVAAYRARDWYPTSVPATVLTALVNKQVYPDPDWGMNLRSIPGVSYGIGMNFSNIAMPPDSPFARSWWYRSEFRIPAGAEGKTLWLNFDAINYRANVWVNGRLVADAFKAAGMYRMFEFDVTGLVQPGAVNVLAVEVFPPTENDLTITFVDWNPMPPDKDMGLVRDVYVLTSGPVALRHPQIASKVDLAADVARLTAAATLRNTLDQPVEGMLKLKIGSIALSRKVQLSPHESARFEFTPAAERQLNVAHPKLWWPNGLGPQSLYSAQFSFETGGQVSDSREVPFGIREITSEIDSQQHRLFKINGKNILIRGGGWTQDMLLRFSAEREEDEIAYARDMHLNTIRLEGKMMNDHFFETCDRDGMLVMAGWCCCSYWERWRDWKPEDYQIAAESLRDQIRRIQNHPSVLAFLYGSDNSPTTPAEAAYLKVFAEEHWPNPTISSAARATTEGAGPTGVKMTGPYDYVAPNYWLLDRQYGGAFGFNTETSPGPAIPEIASLQAMLPKEHLWPIDEFWNFHAGGGSYRNVNLFTAALEARYGKAKGLDDYVRKSQAMTYEGERAMFEAFGRNKYNATGVIQWMMNNAWPSLIWHLYDFYLRPGGGYFGTKKACEPLHVQYSYDDGSVALVNSYYRSFPGYTVSAQVYNLDLTEKFAKSQKVDIAPDSALRVFDLNGIAGLSAVYFVRLRLSDAAGKPVSSNFYWFSTHPDVSDWSKSNGRYTPVQSYADFTELQKLAPVKLKVTSRGEDIGVESSDHVEHVAVENIGTTLAFLVHPRLLKGKDGEELAPVIWEDNYFPLMPGEKREITARCHRAALGAAKAYVKVEGWNVLPNVP